MRGFAAIVLVASAALVGGCGGSNEVEGHVTGPLMLTEGSWDSEMMAQVKGVVSLEADCVNVGGAPVIWPEGTSWSSDSETLTLPGGATVAPGARVSGAGGYYRDLDDLASLFGDEVAERARSCLEEHGNGEGEVAVFNPGSDVRAVCRTCSGVNESH